MKNQWKKIGECAVDSGQIIIVDPCYVLPDKTESLLTEQDYTYDKLLKLREKDSFRSQTDEIVFSGIAGTGIRVDSGIGDGSYDVYARFVDDPDWGHRVAEVRIDFGMDSQRPRDLTNLFKK